MLLLPLPPPRTLLPQPLLTSGPGGGVWRPSKRSLSESTARQPCQKVANTIFDFLSGVLRVNQLSHQGPKDVRAQSAAPGNGCRRQRIPFAGEEARTLLCHSQKPRRERLFPDGRTTPQSGSGKEGRRPRWVQGEGPQDPPGKGAPSAVMPTRLPWLRMMPTCLAPLWVSWCDSILGPVLLLSGIPGQGAGWLLGTRTAKYTVSWLLIFHPHLSSFGLPSLSSQAESAGTFQAKSAGRGPARRTPGTQGRPE